MLLRSLLLHNYVCRRLLFDAWWAFGCVGQKDVMRSHYKPVESHLFYEWERDWEVAADRLGAWWLFCASTHSEIIRIAFCVFCRALEIVERRRFIVISRKLSPSATVIIVIVIVIFALDCLCFNSMLDYYHFFFFCLQRECALLRIRWVKHKHIHIHHFPYTNAIFGETLSMIVVCMWWCGTRLSVFLLFSYFLACAAPLLLRVVPRQTGHFRALATEKPTRHMDFVVYQQKPYMKKIRHEFCRGNADCKLFVRACGDFVNALLHRQS